MHYHSWSRGTHRPGFPYPHGVRPVPDELKAWSERWAAGAWPFPNAQHTHTQHWSISIEVSNWIYWDVWFSHVALPFLFIFTPLQIAALEAAAAAVVNALRLDNFAPGCAENPKLQRHYAAIQALGLTRDISWYRVEPDGKHERLRTTSRMLPVPQTGQKCWIYFGYTTILHTVFRLAWASESQGWIHAANIETYETGDIIMPQCASAISESECQRRLLCKTPWPFCTTLPTQQRRRMIRAWYNVSCRTGPYGETNFRAMESTESQSLFMFVHFGFSLTNRLIISNLVGGTQSWLTHPDCEDLIRFLELPYCSGCWSF